MLIRSEDEMRDFGARLIAACDRGGVITLGGDLGTGKTTLVRGALQSLGVETGVRSPTYTLVESYEACFDAGVLKISHLDLYRIADPEELEFIGWWDLLSEPGLVLVEWPDRGGDLLPENGVRVRIEYQVAGRNVEIWGGPEFGLWEDA